VGAGQRQRQRPVLRLLWADVCCCLHISEEEQLAAAAHALLIAAFPGADSRLSPCLMLHCPPAPAPGMASILPPFDGDVTSLAGTPAFMAPDMLVSTSYDGAKAGELLHTNTAQMGQGYPEGS